MQCLFSHLKDSAGFHQRSRACNSVHFTSHKAAYRQMDRVQHRCRSAASARHQLRLRQNHQSCRAARCSYAATSATSTPLLTLASRCCYLPSVKRDELHLSSTPAHCDDPSASSLRHCQPPKSQSCPVSVWINTRSLTEYVKLLHRDTLTNYYL